LNCQNNNVKRLSIDNNTAKSFNILIISLSVLHTYGPIKLFSDLHLAKFLDALSKIVFSLHESFRIDVKNFFFVFIDCK